jgi:hypothetical protein
MILGQAHIAPHLWMWASCAWETCGNEGRRVRPHGPNVTEMISPITFSTDVASINAAPPYYVRVIAQYLGSLLISLALDWHGLCLVPFMNEPHG